MQLPSQPRPIVASFVAAAIALLPLLLMALSEIYGVPAGVVAVDEVDDAGSRGAALALLAAPFLYLVAVPICYCCGALLVRLRLLRLPSFLAGAAGLALFFAICMGALARLGSQDLLISVGVSFLLLLVMTIPAAVCWWLLAGRLHNLPLQRTAAPSAEL
jgi:hypothetical protein